MNKYIQNYIEHNIDLLEDDILKFVLLVQGNIDRMDELYFILKDANVDIPAKLTHMVAILDAYNRYSTYSSAVCHEFETILEDNGANEDDSGQYGFLTGMSDAQLQKTYNAFRNVVKRMITNDYYIHEETLKLFDI